jgi:SAM-dependent methyltransferase
MVGTPRCGVSGGKAAGIVAPLTVRPRFTGADGAARRPYQGQCQDAPLKPGPSGFGFCRRGQAHNLPDASDMNTANPHEETPSSPLSSSPPKKIRDLSRAFILERLADYYAVQPPVEAVECDYSLWECAETGLQFAWPMLPGNTVFYKWLAGFASYYPGNRWEYRKTRTLLEAKEYAGGKNFKVLDVGCGRGDFLQSLDFLRNENKFALDLNEPAVQECRRRGFQSFCGTMETAATAGFFPSAGFSVVTSFHCLEHVTQPLAFVRSLIGAAASGGRVFISTPLSPMSFEADWFDVMNHPPHHMSRWNVAAYERLAEVLGVKMRWLAPSSSALRRALGVFRLVQYGPNRSANWTVLSKDLLLRFPELVRLHKMQKRRKPSADVILIELAVP